MLGKIILEEAFNLPEWAEMSKYQASLFTADGDGDAHAAKLVDIHQTRLEKMDAHGVEYCVLSLTAPGIQDFVDPKEAAERRHWRTTGLRRSVAALSMHSPEQASEELTRCVKELGFHGSLVNAEQRSVPGGNTPIFYDGPEWDVFWEICVTLNVPFYLHPIAPKGTQFDTYWKARSCLVGPCMSFANGVATHLLGLITNGVFDRHPKLRVIVGHMGEKIPIDFHWLEDVHKPRGSTKMQRTLHEYFATNVFLTTSGNFDTKVLKYVISEVGVDRLLYSLDYPYEAFELGCPWFDGIKPDADISEADLLSIGRTKAIELLGLKLD